MPIYGIRRQLGPAQQGGNQAPTITVPGAQTATEDTPKNITGISIADTNGNNQAVTLSVTNGTLTLAQTTGLSFALGDGTADASMEFSGTLTNVNAALETLTFIPTANYNGSAALSIATNDGAGGIESDAVTINIGASNDAPVLTVPGTQSGTEDTPKAITGISVSDVDNSTLYITLDVTNGTLSVATTSGLVLDSGANGSNSYHFHGSTADVNNALATVTVTPTANFTGAAVLSIAVGDNSLLDSDTITINFAAVNDRPTMTTSGGTTAYTENGSAVVVDSAVTVADVDDTNIESAIVQITSGFHTGDILSVVDQFGVTSAWFPGSAALLFEGTASKAQYETLLQTVKFASSSDNPTSTNRVVTFSVNDGNLDSTGVTKTIAFTAVNDAPVVTCSGGALSYTENAAATAIDTGLTLTDADDTTVSAMEVQITGNYESGADVLAAPANANGITWGSFNSGTGKISATCSGTTIAQARAALRAVTYQSTSENPSTSQRTVTFKVTDGTGLQSSGATKAIDVSRANDAPTITVPGEQSVTMNEPKVINGISIADVDGNNQTVSMECTAGVYTLASTSGLTFIEGTGVEEEVMEFSGSLANINAALNGLTYYPAPDYTGPDEIDISTNDGAGGSDSKIISITTSPPAPDAPDAPEGLILSPDGTNPETKFSAAWSPPSGGITPEGYEVRYSTTDVGFATAIVAFGAPATSPVGFEELEPGQEYFVYVAGYVLDDEDSPVFGPALSGSITTGTYDPTEITSDGGGPTATLYANMGDGVGVTVVIATGDGPVVYSLGTGLNESLFTIDPDTGAVLAPSLATSETLQLEVIASAAGGVDSQIITLHVTNGDGAESGYEPLESPGIEYTHKAPPDTLAAGEFYDDGSSPQNFFFETTPSGSADLLLSLTGNTGGDFTNDRIVFSAFGVSVWAGVHSVVDNLDGTITVNTWLGSIFPFPNGTTVLVQRRPLSA